MTVEIKVGKPSLTLHQGYTLAVAEPDGQMHHGDNRGLYFLDTRLINVWEITANGRPWTLLNSGALTGATGRAYLTNPDLTCESGTLLAQSLGMILSRHLYGGMHDDIDITNHSPHRTRFELSLKIQGDFADLFDVKGNKVTHRGKITTEWQAKVQTLTTRYANQDFCRAFRLTAQQSDSTMTLANGQLTFTVELEPGAKWHTCLLFDFADADIWSKAPILCGHDHELSESTRALRQWRKSVLKVECAHTGFARAFSQSLDDMLALRLPIEGTDHLKFVPAAGLPWFVALFGRDSLVISLQAAIVHPEFALGALHVLAQWQATERDDYRDAEPGKIHHELRRGELAHFKLIPHTPYYGTADATPLYLITLHSVWMCTGNREVLSAHVDTAERCLEWIDKYGDRDGDGFQEYQTRSPVGYDNQGWKDSGEAVIYPDGSNVKGPKALCELQGYVYDAWLRMAQIYDVLGQPDKAAALRAKAAALYDKFNNAFWNEEAGFYALALDGDKKQVMSISSNPGQCLWSGIVPPERARRVVDRLMQADMWCGWGIRTLSADHKSFNPYHYQVGAVWPHDNGFIAQGMKQYGFHAEASRVAEAITRAADFFELDQMPELYAVTQQEPGSFPVQYLGANVPQGWAAGSMFSMLQAMLGFQPDAPNAMLYIDPTLPEWMPELTVRDLKLGSQSFDLRFVRSGERTEFEVLLGAKDNVIRRPMPEWTRSLRLKSPVTRGPLAKLSNTQEENLGQGVGGKESN
ncbi:MAG: glycogen debranching N-terminal domain-containing protein [Burkholderiaceae bacterium]|jgi:glycogen debranching enzyme